MQEFFVGQRATVSIQVKAADGTLADLDSDPACVATLRNGVAFPDTTVRQPAAVTHVSLGLYQAKLLTTAYIPHLFEWTATGSTYTDQFPFTEWVLVRPQPSALVTSVEDLALYLNIPAIDTARAALILRLSQDLCETVIEPMPGGSAAVVLDVAARAYTNPQNAQQDVAGPFTTSYGAVSGGLWLTKKNRASLRRLGGGGGAFSIDPMPSDAGQRLPWWDINMLSTVVAF